MKRKIYGVLIALVLSIVTIPTVLVPVIVSASGNTVSGNTVSGNTDSTTTNSTTTNGTTTNDVVVTESTGAPASAVSIAVEGTTVSILADDVKTEVSSVVSNETHLTNLGVNTSAVLVSSFDLTYSGVMPDGGLQVPITVSVGNVGDYAYILHRRADGLWEKVGEGLLDENLIVTGTFTNFSPVAVMLLDAEHVEEGVLTAPETGQW